MGQSNGGDHCVLITRGGGIVCKLSPQSPWSFMGPVILEEERRKGDFPHGNISSSTGTMEIIVNVYYRLIKGATCRREMSDSCLIRFALEEY